MAPTGSRGSWGWAGRSTSSSPVALFDCAEAERIGFVTRVVPAGSALEAAVELAGEIADAPWTAVVHDRASVYEGLGRTLTDGLANEDGHGRAVIFDPGFGAGVERFADDQARRRRGGER